MSCMDTNTLGRLGVLLSACRALKGSVWCSQQHGDAVSAVRELTMIPANHGDVARCVASSSNLHPALAPLLGAVVAAAGHGLASQVRMNQK